jgi:enoyl-CoA hydratase/carnithine racemase
VAVIRTTAEGDVLHVVFDRPERRNALTREGLTALQDAIGGAEQPVVLLRGAGSAFCAGADLDVVAELDDPAGFARQGQAVADAIASSDSVVVAGVDGPARGGGVELALACDMRVATPDATFAETGVTFGLFGAWGGTVRLPEIVGLGEAMDLALSGRAVNAEDALRMGLVSRIVDDPATVAAELAGNDHDALGVLKRRLRDDGPKADQERREADAFATLHERADFEDR